MKKFYVTLLTFTHLLGQPLTAQGNSVVHLTANNTLSTLIKSKKPVLIRFWAPWCKPCRKMSPGYKKAAKKYAGKVMFAELNVDQYKSVANKYRVRSVPTLILFKNNKIFKRHTGYLDQKAIETFVNCAL